MPRQRLLPHGQVDKPFVLSNEAFSAAEKVSSIKLTPAVKARVVLATMAFVANGQIEQSAPSLAVVHKIKRLLNLTKSLRQDFPDKNKEESPSDLDQTLRVRPISSSRITEFSQHEANGCEAQEDQAAEVEIFPVLGKPAATIEPRNGALDQPLYNVAKDREFYSALLIRVDHLV